MAKPVKFGAKKKSQAAAETNMWARLAKMTKPKPKKSGKGGGS